MAVFTDSAGAYDLTITTAADWTIHSGDMPNGDNSASLSTTLYQNAVWNGEEFCLPVGSGTEARTIEAWVKVTDTASSRTIASVRTDSDQTLANLRQWHLIVTGSELTQFLWYNVTNGNYLSGGSGTLNGWTHIVVVIDCGSTRQLRTYINGELSTTVTTVSGTATAPTSGTYQFYLGAQRSVNSAEMTDHMAKVAWYSRALTTAEIQRHYIVMVAT